MASYSVQYIFNLVDKFSGRAGKMGSAAKKMSSQIHSAGSAANKASAGITKMGMAANFAGGKFTKLAYKMRSLRTIGHSLLSGGLIGMGGGYSAYRAGSTIFNFEDVMNQAQSLMGVSRDAMQPIRDEVIRIGKESSFTSTKVAEGLVELAKAGVYDPEQAKALLDSAVLLAEATGAPMAKVADIVTNISKSFGKKIDAPTMTNMVDILSQAVRRTNFDINQLGEAMGKAAPMAHALNVPLEEVTAVLMTLAQRNIKGGIAGRGLSRMMSQALKMTPKAQKALSSIDLAPGQMFKDGKFQLMETVNLFREAAKIYGNIKVAKVADAVFNTFGGRVMTSLLKSNNGEMENFLKLLLESKGVAQGMRDIRMQGMVGSFRKLIAAVESFVLLLGDKGGLNATITGIANTIRSAVNSLEGMSPAFLKFVAHAALLGAAFAAIIMPLGIFILALSAVGPIFGVIAGMALRMIAPFFSLAGVIGRIALALTSLATGSATLGVMAYYIARVVGGFTLLGGAIAAVIAYSGEIGALFNGMFSGLASGWQGSELQIALSWINSALGSVVSSLASVAGFSFEGTGLEAFFAAGARAAEILLNPLRSIKEMLGYIGRGLGISVGGAAKTAATASEARKMGTKGPEGVAQAAAERVQIENSVSVQTDFAPATVNVTGRLEGLAGVAAMINGSGKLQANRGTASSEAGTVASSPAP